MDNILHINLPDTADYILNGFYQRLFVKHENSSLIIDLNIFEEAISKINNFSNNFIKVSNNQIREYFHNILTNNRSSIECINGKKLEVDIYIEYDCDYCLHKIDDIENDYYYYCYECHNNMCIDCFENETEIDSYAAIPVSFCKNHCSKIKKRNICSYNIYTFNCNNCYKRITDPLFYSDEIDIFNSYDMCKYCNEKYPDIAITRNLHKIESKFPCDDCDFGNMLDWIPLLMDRDDSYILINKNTMEYCVSIVNILIKTVYYVLDIDKINDFINKTGYDSIILFKLMKQLNLSYTD